jgi:hypothetical protein
MIGIKETRSLSQMCSGEGKKWGKLILIDPPPLSLWCRHKIHCGRDRNCSRYNLLHGNLPLTALPAFTLSFLI